MYEFWLWDYVETKYGKKAKLYYIDPVSLYKEKQMIFTKILQQMLKQDLKLQIIS